MRALSPKVRTVEGARCVSWLWSRFSSERTNIHGGRAVYRELILDNFISSSLAAPYTHRDLVEHIAKSSEKPIPIESVSKALSNYVAPRGRTMFGFPGDYLDEIARSYESTWWWMSTSGLNMAVVPSGGSNLSRFDNLAGGLMCEAFLRRATNSYLRREQYMNIALALDEAGLTPVDHLIGIARDRLACRNQKHSKDAIRTFAGAMKSNLWWLNRGVKTRLYRAAERFKKDHPELSEA